MSTPVIVSLTEAGKAFGERLVPLCAGAEHHHRPSPFGERVRAWFIEGRPLVLITATGIAVRTLAAVIGDKRQDPPVLVLDQHGRFVVPLLGGHDAGANDWARRLAEHLGAQAVLTTASAYTHPIWVAGLGCDRGCPREDIQAVLTDVLTAAGLDANALAGLASVDLKADEAGMLALAGDLDRPFTTYPAQALRAHEDALSERSEHVFAAVGCYGVAEAAALARATELGNGHAELVVTKRKNRRATAALARSYPEITHG
ncbi:cobalamin biosynthesis protein [Arhodomonas sp. AD133]|uniref:cobalamin biosynthesis protein n=1 Tax=Arhodomonas sp. AD133 TaxID=3415009 RepID=UPI003EBD0F13